MRGLTQAALAEAAGVTDETVSRLERAAFEPSLSTLMALADALGTEIDHLIGRKAASLPRARAGSPVVRRLSSVAESLTSEAQRAVLKLAELLAAQAPPKKSARRP